MNSPYSQPGHQQGRKSLVGFEEAFDYKVIQSQPLLMRMILVPVVRTSDTPMHRMNRIVARKLIAISTLGFSELVIRRVLRRLFPNP